MIVLVTRGDELLLARSPRFAPGVYSTLAGYVEPGESVEQCVAREVREEVGVAIHAPQYIALHDVGASQTLRYKFFGTGNFLAVLKSDNGGGAITIKANAGITTTAGTGIYAGNGSKSANTGAIAVTLAAGQLLSATGGNGIETDLGQSSGTATVTVNGTVNAADLASMLNGWGTPSYDLTGDGTTNAADAVNRRKAAAATT